MNLERKYTPVLHEAIYSLVITGRSEDYWTAVCLGDNCFETESRFEQQEQVEYLDGGIYPITFQPDDAGVENSARIRSPRAYSLLALAKQAEMIVDHHTYIQELFKTSLDVGVGFNLFSIPT